MHLADINRAFIGITLPKPVLMRDIKVLKRVIKSIVLLPNASSSICVDCPNNLVCRAVSDTDGSYNRIVGVEGNSNSIMLSVDV